MLIERYWRFRHDGEWREGLEANIVASGASGSGVACELAALVHGVIGECANGFGRRWDEQFAAVRHRTDRHLAGVQSWLETVECQLAVRLATGGGLVADMASAREQALELVTATRKQPWSARGGSRTADEQSDRSPAVCLYLLELTVTAIVMRAAVRQVALEQALCDFLCKVDGAFGRRSPNRSTPARSS